MGNNEAHVHQGNETAGRKNVDFAPTRELRSKRQLSNLFTVASPHYQPPLLILCHYTHLCL